MCSSLFMFFLARLWKKCKSREHFSANTFLQEVPWTVLKSPVRHKLQHSKKTIITQYSLCRHIFWKYNMHWVDYIFGGGKLTKAMPIGHRCRFFVEKWFGRILLVYFLDSDSVASLEERRCVRACVCTVCLCVPVCRRSFLGQQQLWETGEGDRE